MFGKHAYLSEGIKSFLMVCLFLSAVIYVTRDPASSVDTSIPLDITDRTHAYTNNKVKRHLLCAEYSIDEDVVATRNPEHYLQYTMRGERDKGGSLIVDLTQTQSRLSTTICGHNFDEPGIKFSDIANVWESALDSPPSILYYNGENTRRYTLLGSYKIKAEEVNLAYPSLNNIEDILNYLAELKNHEGWINDDNKREIGSLLILVTCTEALKNAPHRTILIFAS